MTKTVKTGKHEYNLEDKDAALIETLQDLTESIVKLRLNINGR